MWEQVYTITINDQNTGPPEQIHALIPKTVTPQTAPGPSGPDYQINAAEVIHTEGALLASYEHLRRDSRIYSGTSLLLKYFQCVVRVLSRNELIPMWNSSVPFMDFTT